MLSGALALGRLFGFLREMLLAARLGTSEASDIAIVAMTLPDILIGLLLAGGFMGVLVPVLRRRDAPAQASFLQFALTWCLIVTTPLMLAVALFPEAVFGWLAPALAPEATRPWHWVTIPIAAAIPLAAMSGLLGAALNARGTFFAVGLGIALYNIVLCLALLPGGTAEDVVTRLVLGTLLAAALRLGFIAVLTRPRLALRLRPPPPPEPRLAPLFAAAVLAMGIIFFANILFRTLSGIGGAGDLSAFAYALRLYELPTGLLLAPITTVLLPTLSDQAALKPKLIRRALTVMLAVACLTVAIGWTSGEAIARLIYDRGAMTEAGMTRIVTTALWMFAALPFTAIGLLGTAVLNAQRRTGVVMANAAIALALGGGLALARPDWVLAGFVLFHATVAVLNTARSGIIAAALDRRKP